jgi:hypothetical protein
MADELIDTLRASVAQRGKRGKQKAEPLPSWDGLNIQLADAREQIATLRAQLAAAQRCSTCCGDPESHVSGLLCICGNGTRDGEVDGLRKGYAELSRRLAEAERERKSLIEDLNVFMRGELSDAQSNMYNWLHDTDDDETRTLDGRQIDILLETFTQCKGLQQRLAEREQQIVVLVSAGDTLEEFLPLYRKQPDEATAATARDAWRSAVKAAIGGGG